MLSNGPAHPVEHLRSFSHAGFLVGVGLIVQRFNNPLNNPPAKLSSFWGRSVTQVGVSQFADGLIGVD